jgi:hypothetical protein
MRFAVHWMELIVVLFSRLTNVRKSFRLLQEILAVKHLSYRYMTHSAISRYVYIDMRAGRSAAC